MPSFARALGPGLSRALFALAALILSVGPTLDSWGGAASGAVDAGEASAVVKLVASFDVVDDVLDHLPGKSGGEAQAQQHAVPLASEAVALAPSAPMAMSCVWPLPVAQSAASCAPERLERPPRA